MDLFNQFETNRILSRNQRRNTKPGMPSNAESHKVKFEAPNMEEGHNSVELGLQRYSIFCHQDIETGHFDVTFLFNEKPLHAHSFVLWSTSEVFETMLFGAWAKKEPIPITGHSIEDFKEFLTFLYLGKCTINMENVMGIVDLAESYNVPLLKNKCDQYLTNVTPTAETVFKICETLKIYSLQNALDNLYEFIAINAAALLKNQAFFNTTKDVVLDIVKMERLVIKEEELFDAVYKWAQIQVLKKKNENHLSVKNFLTDILPYIRFPVMNVEFLHSDVVPRGDNLFSSFGELSQILRDADAFQKKSLTRSASKYPCTLRKSFNIELRDNQGNLAHAYINDKNFIETLNNLTQGRSFSSTNSYSYSGYAVNELQWSIQISKPTTPTSSLFDLNACKIYIIRNSQGNLAIKDFSTEQNQNDGLNQMNEYGRVRNEQPNLPEHDIVARVYCDNKNLTIGSGYACYLRVISGNPISNQNQNAYDYY